LGGLWVKHGFTHWRREHGSRTPKGRSVRWQSPRS